MKRFHEDPEVDAVIRKAVAFAIEHNFDEVVRTIATSEGSNVVTFEGAYYTAEEGMSTVITCKPHGFVQQDDGWWVDDGKRRIFYDCRNYGEDLKVFAFGDWALRAVEYAGKVRQKALEFEADRKAAAREEMLEQFTV